MAEAELKPLEIIEFWALNGAEGDGDGGGGDGGGDDGGSDGTGSGDGGDGSDSGLGESGLKALEAERLAAKRAKDAYKPWAAIRREFGLTPEQVREKLAGKSADGDAPDADAIRREAVAEATKKANQRIARSEVRALAAVSFADAEDALLFVDLDEVEVDDDGNVDTESVKRTLADVLKRKPHLAKPKQKNGDFDGGTRTPPPQNAGMSGVIRAARRTNR